jgi:tripartite ATP-independent transporter DctM subunit
MILPICVIIVILGSIFAGLATPTEAAGVGCVGASISALIKRAVSWQMLRQVTIDAARITCMVIWIIFGASFFISICIGIGGMGWIEDLFIGMRPEIILLAMMVTLFIAGCFIDTIAVVLLCAPLFAPIMVDLGFDPIWFGIVFNVNLQMSYISPPFGYSLFYLKASAPKEVTTLDIYRSVLPFIALQAIGLLIMIMFPDLVLWLPNLMID